MGVFWSVMPMLSPRKMPLARRKGLRPWRLMGMGVVLWHTALPVSAQPWTPKPLPRATAAVQPSDCGPRVKLLPAPALAQGPNRNDIPETGGWPTPATAQGTPVSTLSSPAQGNARATFTPLVAAQSASPPSALWLALMPLVPVMGGLLTYLHREFQWRRRRLRRHRSLRSRK